ncbi:hypothetical protein GJAV_G00243750 [Gymnothorax javanicus]|nr:hypothetical protein GJAV_G00243750 [Gymnothorax javanicus]
MNVTQPEPQREPAQNIEARISASGLKECVSLRSALRLHPHPEFGFPCAGADGRPFWSVSAERRPGELEMKWVTQACGEVTGERPVREGDKIQRVKRKTTRTGRDQYSIKGRLRKPAEDTTGTRASDPRIQITH